ncbi:MAG: AAA family ATPase, partial [Oscillospiraceae bacterium]|nr:AAA family ATPase [Oscillospiraceae bacterium]
MSKQIKQIAIYGKGGIGKSTTTSNLSAALSKMGFKVMQFGCDPKSDSTNTLRDGSYIPTVLDTLREKSSVDAHDVIFEGFNGIYCVEAGGPAPGVGCAGRGIITAVELFKHQRIFEELDLDYVIYDVLGDVVCGGFAVPIREGIAQHVFTVSSSDFMSIYAANNLFRGIQKYSRSGGALL